MHSLRSMCTNFWGNPSRISFCFWKNAWVKSSRNLSIWISARISGRIPAEITKTNDYKILQEFLERAMRENLYRSSWGKTSTSCGCIKETARRIFKRILEKNSEANPGRFSWGITRKNSKVKEFIKKNLKRMSENSPEEISEEILKSRNIRLI